jgi:glycosyltransferase involved in cell wall biosynthesis
VLAVTPRYLPAIGGVERYVHEIARRLAVRGVEISVLTTDPTGHLPPHEIFDGVAISRVRAWPRRRDYYFAPDVYRTIVTSGAWDLVHVQSYHTFVAPLAMLAAGRRKLPYCVTFHGGGHSSPLRQLLRRPQWALLRPLLAGAFRLVAIAPFEIDLYARRLRLPTDRFTLIPSGTDFAAERLSSCRGGLIRPVIASVGRLERYKGHQRLIAALPRILEQRPDVSVWIAGSGPYEPNLRRLARKLGVADRVDIRAVSERGVLARELSTVALVVLLSDYETQPLAVLEAVALRRPALVLDTPGLFDLAERGLARAIPHDSTAEHIAEAVLEQLTRPFVPGNVELPTWDECTDRHLELYLEVAERTGAFR